MIICGIGSRETPVSILREMTLIGEYCRTHNIWVRSGHAPGADQAFELGAQEMCIAYLPWNGFMSEMKTRAHYRVPADFTLLMKHAQKFHPAWMKLSEPVRKLMARNSAQILGEQMNSPVQAVVAWTKDGLDVGGTSQAIRIARANNIPVLNMAFSEYSNYLKIQTKLVEFLNLK